MTPRTAIVIGAGFGGLALAVRLQAAGVRTILLEKRDKPGGRAYVYEDQGYVFDGGPTVITDPDCLREVFASAGADMDRFVELLPITPFYRLAWEDGATFDYSNDQAALDAAIASFSPKDVAAYRRFLAYSKELYREGYEKLGAKPFQSFTDMVRAAPQLARLQAWRSVYSAVARHIENERLRQVFSFHTLLVGGNPFATSAIYALIHALERHGGVWFARGGTGALVDAFVRLFQSLGGELRLNAPVDEIVTQDGRVTGVRTGGAFIAADAVASNADVVHTYAKLLGGSDRGRREGARLAGKRHSMSLFVIYFGLRRIHRQLAHHTVCFGPRYRELIGEIFAGPRVPDDFSLYLHAPSVTDESLAPPGCGSY
ncbi:MAG TPA: phytoene desaturase family protein, partial [Beijerinckiaceae bacterium]